MTRRLTTTRAEGVQLRRTSRASDCSSSAAGEGENGPLAQARP
jgi:hypothetical protein